MEYATRIAALTEGLKSPKDDESLYRSIRKKMRKVILFEMKLAKVYIFVNYTNVSFSAIRKSS